MKVNLDLIGKALIGRIGKLVFYRFKKSNVLIARAYKKPRLTQNNFDLRTKAKNLGVFYHNVSDGYKRDLRNYATNLNNETIGDSCIYNMYNVFIKMMYGLKRIYPEVDLKTITPEIVIEEGYPVDTISHAVDACTLPEVKFSNEFTNPII